MMFSKRTLMAALAALVLLLGGCGSNGLPGQQGMYDLQADSITYDGQDYSFYWADKDKSLHRARSSDIKMVQDERTYLEIKDGDRILHLAADEPITVRAQDGSGGFGTFWFPFMLGQAMGRSGPVVINQPYPGTPQTTTNAPTYHYPPSDTFGRDEELHGSVTNNKPSTPDYGKVKPGDYAVSGKSGGAGAGTSATGKSGVSGGQAGGSGSGTAASQKGGFSAGKSGFSSKAGSSSVPKVGGGSGKSSGITKSRGGFSGARSSGARGGGK